MSKKNKEVNNKEQEEPKQAGKTAESAENKAGNEQKGKEEAPEVDEEAKKIEQKLNTLLKENEELKASVAKEKDDYIRLMADFENFRRHSAEAKLELVSSAAADTIKGLLPVLDDCERAMKMLEENSADEVAKEGTALIFNKLMGYLKTKGLEVIKAKGEKFDTDFHEAVAQFPVPEEDKKGLVYDVVQTGYTLSGKVIRYAKVVVGI
ncbi:MAG: nucleotide exchange factor GrpE [Alistipes sp.]|jgi:molecular chaperone GrpE|uniref:nucleotide exchange factor GrpE n=1 Tax=Candidatus Cryptobacteroides bacterium TaxID=3085639 RepID=UPI00033928EA|nr:nucleotide exchange factor GrpE [Alistipes sp.]MDY3834906.1 nucleotide exchange factor GrpE [Candidatus Cryptobacteroides sp.]MEE0429374.1 nucleotide exchange factor GrpE [Bacteroidales bacterium]CDD15273.1 protein GrpE [Alistipes sp. CAG:435]MCI6439542.1 nucleotide exchange factor GrpE [Alistipes sp.]